MDDTTRVTRTGFINNVSLNKFMIILTKKEIFETYKNKTRAKKVVKTLLENKLLPLHASKELSSIVGHLMGDGNLNKDVFVGDFRFYGTKKKLEYIMVKVFNVFDIAPKRFYKRKEGFVLKYNNSVISRLLHSIGVPRGNKVNISFRVPYWIKKSNETLVQRSFLTALCDDELSSPRYDKRGYIEPLRLKFNKNEKIISSGFEFLEDLRELFWSMGVKTSSIKMNNEIYTSINHERNRSIYFNISSKRENLYKFKEKIGFESEDLKKIKLKNMLELERKPL